MLPEQELVEALARIDELEAEVEKRSYENHLLNEDLKTEAAQVAELREAIQACVDDDFNSNALMIELTALVKPGM